MSPDTVTDSKMFSLADYEQKKRSNNTGIPAKESFFGRMKADNVRRKAIARAAASKWRTSARKKAEIANTLAEKAQSKKLNAARQLRTALATVRAVSKWKIKTRKAKKSRPKTPPVSPKVVLERLNKQIDHLTSKLASLRAELEIAIDKDPFSDQVKALNKQIARLSKKVSAAKFEKYELNQRISQEEDPSDLTRSQTVPVTSSEWAPIQEAAPSALPRKRVVTRSKTAPALFPPPQDVQTEDQKRENRIDELRKEIRDREQAFERQLAPLRKELEELEQSSRTQETEEVDAEEPSDLPSLTRSQTEPVTSQEPTTDEFIEPWGYTMMSDWI